MGAVDTTYTFTATDTITSTKMNNIIDQTTITSDAITGTTLEVSSGKLKVRAAGITSNELGADSVKTASIEDGAVTQAKTSNMLVPAGAIMAFAMNAAPTGWLAANGALVSTTEYASLFAAIGYTYGGSGGSFNLPDLRGYFVRGSGTNSDGSASGTFGAKQQDDIESHTHTTGETGTGVTSNAVLSTGTIFVSGNGANATGATGGTETRPKNIAMLYCIKL